MTVAVNLTTTTTTVVLPCSSYLSAQSVYIESLNPDGFFQESYGIEDDPLVDWQTNFDESPECRAYANAIKKGQYTASNDNQFGQLRNTLRLSLANTTRI